MSSSNLRLSKLSLGLLAALAVAPVFAQSTSSGIAGRITTANGQPVAGAEVTITHVESGTVSRTTTDANGRYASNGLRVGGPYTVVIKGAAGTDTESNIFLPLNQVTTVNAQLGAQAASNQLGSVTVTGSRNIQTFNSDNKGLGTNIGGRQLAIAPQGSRSMDDVARLDPRITVSDQATGAITVAGVNNRFNTISVDGLSQGDPFGLNANGMPYTNSPISTDTIAAYDIKVSDYDVAQDTVGATVNAVTKSGGNNFHGSVYYAYKNAGNMVASKNGQKYTGFGKDTTRGVTFSGPILKDKLFFFGSYEDQKVTNFGGASGSDGFSNGVVSQSDIDQVISIAKSKYGIDAGTYGALGVDLNNKRYLGKLDWNINDNHRASLTYQRTEETLPQPYDGGVSTVILSTRWYTKTSVTKNMSLQLFSDWTDDFSTEAKFSTQKFDQVAGNAVNLPTVNVTTGTNSASSGQGVRFGEDRNRHENKINSKRITASVFGTYRGINNHVVKLGFDYLNNDALNLYGRDLHGVYTFGSIADFASGNYYRYDVRRPVGGFTENDLAAAISLKIISPFIQDTWQVNDNLSVLYGVRVNIPEAAQPAPENKKFQAAFGFPNNYRITSSNRVVMPRLSFNYKFNTTHLMQLRGGAGLFQSVPPFVWLANPYQNNGVTSASFCASSPTVTLSGCVKNAGNIYPFSPDPYHQNVPANLSASGAGQVDSIDPSFKLPTVWKFSLGFDAELPWYGLVASAEVLHLKNKDGIYYKAINIGKYNSATGMYDAPTGMMPDGRESYWCTPGTGKNCGINTSFTNQSTVLSNTKKGGSTAITLSLNKPMSHGWYGNLSYTNTHAKEVGSDGSSQAWSSYQFVSRLNPNEEVLSTATREIRHSLKLSMGWEHAFFGNYKTSITGYYNRRSGLPYTWIINGDPNGDSIFQDPAYIPNQNDPLVSYVYGGVAATPAQIAAFQSAIDGDKYLRSHRGQIAGRNDVRTPWVNQLDLGIQQELPGFMKGHKSILRLDVYNFLNMLNKKWGVTENVGGFDTRYFSTLNKVNANGTYVYDLKNNSPQTLSAYDFNSGYPSRVVSRWSVLATLKYTF